MSARALRSLLVLSVLAVSSTAFAQGADEETFKTLFREGIEEFKRGNVEEAYQKLEQALRIKVDDRLVLYMRDEAQAAVLQRMLMAGGKIRETALRILELAKGKAEDYKRDHDEREKLVLALDSNDFTQVTEATLKLQACGTWACENLVAHLGDAKSETLRTNVIVCLTRMRDEATLAVNEALSSSDKLTKQNACVVLGNMGDIRGLGELRRVAEDGSEDAEVKAAATRAIDRIMAGHPEEQALVGKVAKETYVILAERWYRSHPSVMHYMFGNYVVWRWSPSTNALVGREVPPFAMNEELAEEACHDAIMLDNGYEAAWALLCCVSMAQFEEANVAKEDAEHQFAMGWISAEDKDRLMKEIETIHQAEFLGQMVGSGALYAGLAKSLADDSAEVSVLICRALKNTAKWEELTGVGAPLAEALMNSDKRVRYEAAMTIAALRPKQTFTNWEAVVTNLADAAAEQAVRVVLIIEGDDNTRHQMAEVFRSIGCYVTEAPDAKRGIMKAKEFPNADLIVCDGTILQTVVFSVNILGKNQAETSVLDSLQQDLRTKRIPVILTAPDAAALDKWKEIFKDEVKGYLVKSEVAAAVKSTVDPIFAEEPTLSRSKRRAEKSAQDANETLSRITIQDTIFTNYASAVPSCIQALDGRIDPIRIAACAALGALGDASANDSLAKLLSDGTTPVEVRIAAALGLARIFQQSGASPGEDHVKALVAGITDADVNLNRATSKAIGAAKLSAEQRAQIFAAERLHQLK